MKICKKGFTLIELLVVVAIVGILATVAIPQFNEYRKSARNSSAVADLKNAITAQEAYYADNGVYLSCDMGGGLGPATICTELLPGFELSSDVQIGMFSQHDDTYLSAHSCHDDGNTDYDWISGGRVSSNDVPPGKITSSIRASNIGCGSSAANIYLD